MLYTLVFIASSFAAEVKSTVSRQEGNRVIWEFEVVSDTQEEADLNLTITIDGKTYESKDLHLEGDFPKAKPGKGKKIYWNVLQDFPRGMHGNLDWELVAGGMAFVDPVTGMEFIFVKGGCFDMGDTFGDGRDNEKPVHNVCVADFYIGKYEVTVGQFKIFVNDAGYRTEAEKGDGCYTFTDTGLKKDSTKSWRSPGLSQDDQHPVVCVSWNDTNAYTKWLSGKTSKSYHLPTEAESEFAARSGGKKEKYAGTSSDSDLVNYAWYTSNSGGKTHPVGQKRPNSLGLYDMSGNVREWVQDWYDENYYKYSPRNNPQGPIDSELAQGALVFQVFEKSPAKKGGIRKGDVIVTYDGVKIGKDLDSLPKMVASTEPGKKAKVTIIRGREIEQVDVIPINNEIGIKISLNRMPVLRGGGWDSKPQLVRAAVRDSFDPGGGSSGLGFRVVSSSR